MHGPTVLPQATRGDLGLWGCRQSLISLLPAAITHTPVQQPTRKAILRTLASPRLAPSSRSPAQISHLLTTALQPSGSYTFLESSDLGATPALGSAIEPHNEPPEFCMRCLWSSHGPLGQHSTQQLLSLSSQISLCHHRPLPASCRSTSASWKK